jgi:hypothetical protein
MMVLKHWQANMDFNKLMLAQALALAITASTEVNSAKATRLAESIAKRMSKADVEIAKEAVELLIFN